MKLQKFYFSKKLPNLLKYGEVKFNFKSFIENFALHSIFLKILLICSLREIK